MESQKLTGPLNLSWGSVLHPIRLLAPSLPAESLLYLPTWKSQCVSVLGVQGSGQQSYSEARGQRTASNLCFGTWWLGGLVQLAEFALS